VQRFAREAKGHGIPEVMEAVALRGGKIRARVAFVKVIASALTIGSGGSAGREGPVVQIGSSLASSLSGFLGFNAERTKTLVACGAAAGIAATFNAPIAGVVFSLEIITGSFGIAAFTPVVSAAVMATVVTHYTRGNIVVFHVPEKLKQATALGHPLEVLSFAVLGLLAGLAAILYIKALYATEDRFDRLRKVPAWVRPALGGLLVGVVGLAFPRVLGQGYETVLDTLLGHDLNVFERWGGLDLPVPAVLQTCLVLLALCGAKILATSLTIGSGGSGGVFAPSLYIGACLGAAFGLMVNAIDPDSTSAPAGYALVGMAALVSGVTHAPISAVLILFEMTDDYDVILPLMLASVISTAVCSHMLGESIYTLKLRRKGVRLHEGREQTLLRTLRVREAMRSASLTIPEGTPFRRVVQMATGSTAQTFPVVDGDGHLVGVLTFEDLRESLMVQGLGDLVIARELAVPVSMRVTPDDNLHHAFEAFDECGLDEVPVVHPEDEQRLVGMLARADAMNAYNRALGSRRPSSSAKPS
jgi:CIC family chloride channel protein